ncbi:hypothetical protein DM02DRAFT_609298 [Periconia macrospinosa]|uniref:Uncharacterized protein n=1 Tax=Periconia macrospinosa TaxID=97972 RepID=A0A2V1EB83_9PLEO|nr:hypothetical protein DM02DRAFT_609298 [Periconia macrospinosa]
MPVLTPDARMESHMLTLLYISIYVYVCANKCRNTVRESGVAARVERPDSYRSHQILSSSYFSLGKSGDDEAAAVEELRFETEKKEKQGLVVGGTRSKRVMSEIIQAALMIEFSGPESSRLEH